MSTGELKEKDTFKMLKIKDLVDHVGLSQPSLLLNQHFRSQLDHSLISQNNNSLTAQRKEETEVAMVDG